MGKARERKLERQVEEDKRVQEAYDAGVTHYNGRRIIPGAGLEKSERVDGGVLPNVDALLRLLKEATADILPGGRSGVVQSRNSDKYQSKS